MEEVTVFMVQFQMILEDTQQVVLHIVAITKTIHLLLKRILNYLVEKKYFAFPVIQYSFQ